MSASPTPAPQPPAEATPAGTAGIVSVVLRFIDRLNNERLLLLVVVVAFGYTTLNNLKTQSERETFQARQYEESRAQDRRHCDDREDKIRKDKEASEEKMRQWYTSLIETQKRSELEQREKDRVMLAEYARIIAKLMPQILP